MFIGKEPAITRPVILVCNGGNEGMKSKGKWIVLWVALMLFVLGSLSLMLVSSGANAQSANVTNAQSANNPLPPGSTDLLVASYSGDSVLRFDGTSGNFVSVFVS